jgi:hypothetical protein
LPHNEAHGATGETLERGSLPVLMNEETGSVPSCRQCSGFVDDPAAIELEFPGLGFLGSAYASVRGSAGVCTEFNRLIDPIPAAECPAFTPDESL